MKTCGGCGGEWVYISKQCYVSHHPHIIHTQRVTVSRGVAANRGGSQGGALEVSRTPVEDWDM